MKDESYQLARLREGIKPARLRWFPRLRSTNDHAAGLRARGDLFAPALVLTGRQTAGRGRGGNIWWSNGQVITATFVYPADEHLPAGELPLVAGLAVRNACSELSGSNEIELKWPNDVLFEGRKLAGLLCERVNKVDLIGIGLNVNVNEKAVPVSLRKTIVSLSTIADRTIGMTNAVLALHANLRVQFARRSDQPFSQIIKDYERHHYLTGKRVKIENAGEATIGKVKGIDPTGRLILDDGYTLHRIFAGHVTLE